MDESRSIFHTASFVPRDFEIRRSFFFFLGFFSSRGRGCGGRFTQKRRRRQPRSGPARRLGSHARRKRTGHPRRGVRRV